MTTITATGALLTADADNRVLTYRLLPYGEQGRTNVGLITASKGSVTLPEDPSTMHLNLQHDRTRPVGRAVSLTEDDGGLIAAFKIANTTAGSDLLAEATEGLRPGVSVEVDNPVIRNGHLVGGALVHAGAVTEQTPQEQPAEAEAVTAAQKENEMSTLTAAAVAAAGIGGGTAANPEKDKT